MSGVTRLDRERARQLLAQVESIATSPSKAPEIRQKVVKLLNSIPTYGWVGIYLARANGLNLDAWSGPAATIHTVIPVGKGICGWAAKTGRTEIVSDVSKDSRYLQCFATTRSEIVVPVIHNGKVVGEIDIDSDELNAHSSVDREFLEAVAGRISQFCTA